MLKVFSALVLFAYCQCILAQTNIIGKSCSQKSDCGSSNIDVICKDSVCTCSDNTVPTYDSRQCISTVSHNGVCQEGIQCSYSTEAECSNRRCQCREGYSYNGVTCVGETSGTGLGSSCQVNAQCTVPGDLAQKTVWCGNDRQCSCRNGYTRENERCVIGGLCTTNEQCTDNGLENSWCDIRPRDDRRFSCSCNSSFIAAVNNTRCLPIVHELGSGCEDSAQCSAKLGDAYCSARYQCSCVEGAQIKDNICSSGAVISMMFSISYLALVVIVKLF